MNTAYKAIVNETFEFSLLRKNIESLDILSVENHSHIVYKDQSLKIEVISKDLDDRIYHLKINGNHFHVKIENELDALITEMGLSTGEDIITNEIHAPMPGLIIEVNVKVGQEVKEGEFLCVLEAMKMENAMMSPRDGTIKAINISEGNTVDKGDLLIEFEA